MSNTDKMLNLLGTLIDYNGTKEQIKKGILDLNNLFSHDQKLDQNQMDYVYTEAICNWTDEDQPLSDFDNAKVENSDTICIIEIN